MIETIIGIVIIIEVVDKGDRDRDQEIGCNREEITTAISSIGIIMMIKTVVESTITTTVIKTAEKIVVEIEIEEAVEASLTHNQAIGRGESNLHHPHHRGHRLHPHHHQGRRRLRRGCRCRIRP